MSVWHSKGGGGCLKTGVLRSNGGFSSFEMGVWLWDS